MSWEHPRGLRPSHQHLPDFDRSHPITIVADVDGDWHRGDMVFYRSSNEVRLDLSATHIGSITNNHFLAQDSHHNWFHVHVNHSRDGAAHIYTSPANLSEIPDVPVNQMDPLPPIPAIDIIPPYDPPDDAWVQHGDHSRAHVGDETDNYYGDNPDDPSGLITGWR